MRLIRPELHSSVLWNRLQSIQQVGRFNLGVLRATKHRAPLTARLFLVFLSIIDHNLSCIIGRFFANLAGTSWHIAGDCDSLDSDAAGCSDWQRAAAACAVPVGRSHRTIRSVRFLRRWALCHDRRDGRDAAAVRPSTTPARLCNRHFGSGAGYRSSRAIVEKTGRTDLYRCSDPVLPGEHLRGAERHRSGRAPVGTCLLVCQDPSATIVDWLGVLVCCP